MAVPTARFCFTCVVMPRPFMVCGTSPTTAFMLCCTPSTVTDVTVSSSVPSADVDPFLAGAIAEIWTPTGDPAAITTRPLSSSTSRVTDAPTALPTASVRDEMPSRRVTSMVVPLATVRFDENMLEAPSFAVPVLSLAVLSPLSQATSPSASMPITTCLFVMLNM